MILMDETGIASFVEIYNEQMRYIMNSQRLVLRESLVTYIMNSQRLVLRESLVTWYKFMFLFAGMLSSLPTV